MGCLEALLEDGIFPELIVGTSVGALNGVFLAKAPTIDGVSELRDLWLGLEPHGSFRDSTMRGMLRLFTGRQYLYALDTLGNSANLLGLASHKHFERNQIWAYFFRTIAGHGKTLGPR